MPRAGQSRIISRKGAMTPSSEEKHYSSQTKSLPLIRPLRLGAFAGEYPVSEIFLLVACGERSRTMSFVVKNRFSQKQG
jgi:hypothetical protein